ncbi:hypothetical protein QTP88_005534 [Uroleucon formosanum]
MVETSNKKVDTLCVTVVTKSDERASREIKRKPAANGRDKTRKKIKKHTTHWLYFRALYFDNIIIHQCSKHVRIRINHILPLPCHHVLSVTFSDCNYAHTPTTPNGGFHVRPSALALTHDQTLQPPPRAIGKQSSAPTSPEPSNQESVSGESFIYSGSSSTSHNSDRSPTPPNPPTPHATPRERIPTIIIDPSHWAIAASQIIHLFTQDQLTAKFGQNNIKLQAADSNIFRSIQTIMGTANIPFHTFSLPTKRQLKVLLRGIPSYNSKDSVKSELELQGYTVTHVRQFLKDGR